MHQTYRPKSTVDLAFCRPKAECFLAKYAIVPEAARWKKAWCVMSVNHTTWLADTDNTKSIERHTWKERWSGRGSQWRGAEGRGRWRRPPPPLYNAKRTRGISDIHASRIPMIYRPAQLPVWPAKKLQSAVQQTINDDSKSRRINLRRHQVEKTRSEVARN